MNSIECFQEYLALKNHFKSESYNYFIYNGKIKSATPEHFRSRKDKFFFERLAKHEDLHNFLVANFINNEKIWIKELTSEDAEKVYRVWLQRQQSLSYIFKQDIENLESIFNINFICTPNDHPPLLKKYLRGEVCLETLCILLDILNAKKYWDSELKDDVLWEQYSLKVKKYTPFIKYDKEKFKKTCRDFFKE